MWKTTTKEGELPRRSSLRHKGLIRLETGKKGKLARGTVIDAMSRKISQSSHEITQRPDARIDKCTEAFSHLAIGCRARALVQIEYNHPCRRCTEDTPKVKTLVRRCRIRDSGK